MNLKCVSNEQVSHVADHMKSYKQSYLDHMKQYKYDSHMNITSSGPNAAFARHGIDI